MKLIYSDWNVGKGTLCVDSITMTDDRAVVEGDAVDMIGRHR